MEFSCPICVILTLKSPFLGLIRMSMPIVYVYATVTFWSILHLHYFPFTEHFKRQYHKMVKHTHTIRRQIADELFEYV